MLIRIDQGFEHTVPSEITPAHVYARRRDFLRQMAVAGWLASSGLAESQTTTCPGNRVGHAL